MKRITFLLLVFNFVIMQTRAQTEPPAPPPTTTEAGRLIIQFWQAIRPNSFSDQWSLKTNSWAKTAAKTPNATALAGNASFLANYIKPMMFKNGFSIKDFNKTASRVRTYPEAYKVLQNLEDGLQPGVFNGRWSNQRGHWLHDLSLLR